MLMDETFETARDRLERMDPAHQLELMRALVESAPDAIIAHETDGTIVFFNKGACDLLGLSSEQMNALGPFGWVGPGSLRGATDRLETILYEGETSFSSTIQRPDGQVIPTDVTSRRVDTELGPLIVAVIRDVEIITAANEKLVYLAYHDSLTALPNRTAFNERLSLAIADAERYGDLLVVAYIDLDDFKPLNDHYGHETGDRVLIELGRRLCESVRTQDMVARLGGDEFVVLLERVESQDEIPVIARRLLANIRRPVEIEAMRCHVDASIGFAVFRPEEDDLRSIVAKADLAMYAAKRDADHPWTVYEAKMGMSWPRGRAT